jgi:RNA-directed DNA polymerase
VMHGHEKSDFAIVATKLPNKAGRPAAEAVERRAGTKGNMSQQNTRRAQIRERVSHALERVRNAARQRKKEKFTALLHHISVETLNLELGRRASSCASLITEIANQEQC